MYVYLTKLLLLNYKIYCKNNKDYFNVDFSI